MQDTLQDNLDSPAGLSATVTVMLSASGGLQLPPTDQYGACPLGYAGLRLLGQAADREDRNVHVAARALAPELEQYELEEIETLLASLSQRGLLVPEPGQAPAAMPPIAPASDWEPADYTRGEWLVELPLVLAVTARGFEVVSHQGRVRICLTAEELVAVACLRQPVSLAAALEAHQQVCAGHALDQSEYRALMTRLDQAALLQSVSSASAGTDFATIQQQVLLKRMNAVTEVMDGYVQKKNLAERRRREEQGQYRVPVVPVCTQRAMPPLALGMIVAAARAHENGALAEHYWFVMDWESRVIRLQQYAREPSIYIFSSYIWSHVRNLALSEQIKQFNPNVLTVHGGPDVPKYPADVEAYFRDYPHVDVVVHGEGEETFSHLLDVMRGHIGEASVDLAPLKHVPGLTFRLGGDIIRTAPRPQIRDLDTIPSPLLDGTFEAYELAGKKSEMSMTIETNRGCPYGCTFCDWGSATASKVRRFDMARVFAELEWCARNRVANVFVADANFGIYERDVDITRKVAELKREYGYPLVFTTNYAKNKVKYLRQIVEILAEADILTEGLLSLQSMDDQTLSVIDRSNIKTEKYDELAREFRKAGLPLFVDIMLGLPGSTRQSFASDLQQCVDREVTARVFQTEMLVNSPMNAPEYKEKYRIETANAASGEMFVSKVDESTGLGRAMVVACSSFSREDYMEMLGLRQAYRLFENFGVLRQVSRFVRRETGVQEVAFIEHLRQTVSGAPERWPYLAFTLRSLLAISMPPVSWHLLMEEVHQFLLAYYPIEDDSALHTVLAVQAALLPARDRKFPTEVSLPHDYAAWYQAMVQAKDEGYLQDWENKVPRLREFPPATMEVRDPGRVCTVLLGYNSDGDLSGDWELQSPVSRGMPKRYLEYAESA